MFSFVWIVYFVWFALFYTLDWYGFTNRF